MEEINLPKSITKISSSDKLFAQCPNLISGNAPGITTVPKPSSGSSGMFYQCPKLEYVTFGSEEHPFTSWSEYSSNNSTINHHLYVTKSVTLKFVNLLTRNGKQEDVAFPTISFTNIQNSNKMIFTRKPIERYTDELGFSYYIFDETANIVGYTGSATELEIPTTIKGLPVVGIESNVFKNNTALTKVIAPNITTLGSGCFENCNKLTSIELPKATRLGHNCFYYCTGLTSINLPEATSLGNRCFENCNKLTSIELPKVTSLGDNCFYYCTGLTSIEIPNATSLGDSCFEECTSLTSIEIPKVTSLGNRCFYTCIGLTSIKLPQVTAIGSKCFVNCYVLKNVILGDIGSPITNTDNFNATAMDLYVESITIYVRDSANPPTLSGIPWNAGSATITYEQA